MLQKMLRSPFIPLLGYLLIIGFFLISLLVSQNHQSLVWLSLLTLTAFSLIWVSLISWNNRKHPENKLNAWSLIPPEFREMDEGQQWITFKACRNVYIFYSFALPLIAGLCFAFSDIKFMPLLLIGALGTGQYIVYWMTIKKLNRL
ncbi:hypothetical protein [Domibacillus robiginosus]|uniref:hypothetical protein n=1 Tax=Domibacillus robiginosus TaxID=1071054 RepID=UPI00067B3993|nr:hypothetical protein [Domibacillus robiginosus]